MAIFINITTTFTKKTHSRIANSHTIPNHREHANCTRAKHGELVYPRITSIAPRSSANDICASSRGHNSIKLRALLIVKSVPELYAAFLSHAITGDGKSGLHRRNVAVLHRCLRLQRESRLQCALSCSSANKFASTIRL